MQVARLVALLGVIVSGCDSTLTGPQKDYNKYLDQLRPLWEENIQILDDFSSEAGTGLHSNREAILTMLDRVIPRSILLVGDLRRIEPQNGELYRIHSLLAEAWDDYSTAFQGYKSVLAGSDSHTVEELNEMVSNANGLLEEYAEQLEDHRASIDSVERVYPPYDGFVL